MERVSTSRLEVLCKFGAQSGRSLVGVSRSELCGTAGCMVRRGWGVEEQGAAVLGTDGGHRGALGTAEVAGHGVVWMDFRNAQGSGALVGFGRESIGPAGG